MGRNGCVSRCRPCFGAWCRRLPLIARMSKHSWRFGRIKLKNIRSNPARASARMGSQICALKFLCCPRCVQRDIRLPVCVKSKLAGVSSRIQKTLQEARDKQLAAMQRENPSADICAEILKNRTPELWSRNPKNENFYAVRLGTGDITATVCAQFAADPFSGNEDPLQTRAAELADQSKLLTDAPVVLQGQKNCVVGIVGDRKLTDQMQQNLLIRLSTLCASTDLRFWPTGLETRARSA